MSEPKHILHPSDHLRQHHDIPVDHHVTGHRIIVAGVYSSNEMEHGGALHKIRKPYQEEFILRPRDHKLVAQNCLAHVLRDGQLKERLEKKDKNFRAILSHEIVLHENLYEKTEEKKTDAPESDA